MKIGPFDSHDAARLEELLEKHAIDYEIEIEEDLKQSSLDLFHDEVRRRTTAAVGSLDLRYISYFVDDKALFKISHELEKFGIVP
jgi:hypothetical protein